MVDIRICVQNESVSFEKKLAQKKQNANVDQGPLGNTTNARDYKTSLIWKYKIKPLVNILSGFTKYLY